MNPGKQFENDVKKSVPAGVYYLRLHDSANGFRDARSDCLRFAVKSPYDMVLCRKGQMYCLELKSTSGKAFSFNGSNPMIKKDQIIQLHNALVIGGAVAGFLLNFRETDETYWIPVDLFEEFMRVTEKCSMNIREVRDYGLRVPQKKLRVHNRYDLSVLWKNEERFTVWRGR